MALTRLRRMSGSNKDCRCSSKSFHGLGSLREVHLLMAKTRARAHAFCFLTSGRLPAGASSDIAAARDTQRRGTWVVAGEVSRARERGGVVEEERRR
jgi:hypothetical protein